MRFIAVAGVIAVVFASANLPLASAHAAVDQTTDQCFTTPGGAVDITYAGPVGQSFRPTRARLTGVDIALQDFDVDSVNPTVRIQIREGTISGLVVGQTTSVVPDGINQEWWHIDFPTDVLVTPGNTYVIHVSLVGVGQNLVIDEADAQRLAAAGVEFAYLHDHQMPDGEHRLVTVPVN